MIIDTLIEDATVLTMDPRRPRADSLGILHGRVVGLGEDLNGVVAERVVRLDGACVVPGFHDAHNHMVHFGLSLAELDLSDAVCHTLDDVYRLVAERAAALPRGSWIVGSRYDQNKLGGHPHRDALDRVAPDHLVWLKHTSAHMCVVNSRLLDDIGLGPAGTAVVPEGGSVALDAQGRPTGLLEEQAQRLVRDLVLPYPQTAIVEAIRKAGEVYLSEGITSCTEAGIGGGWIGHSPQELGAYLTAREQGALRVRVQLMAASDCLHPLEGPPEDPGTLGLDLGIRTGLGGEHLSVGAVKVFTDGSLVGRTAALSEDYVGEPGNGGYLQDDPERLRRLIVAAHVSGWQVAAHAIGDRAIDLVLDALEEAQRRHPRSDARHRLEHAGVTRPDQLARLARLRVVPVPQGRFISALGDGMAAAVGPERVPWCYRMRSFLDAGLVVAGSSDRPVVPGAPLGGIHDLVNRTTGSGVPFGPDEAVTVEEAIRAWTYGSAYAAGQDQFTGTLSPGKAADLAVLSDDPTRVDPGTIKDIEVVSTLVGGDARHGGDAIGWDFSSRVQE